RGVAFGLAAGAASLAVATALVVTAHAPQPDLPFSRPFRGRIDPGGDGPRLYAGATAIVAPALREAALPRFGARGLAALAGARGRWGAGAAAGPGGGAPGGGGGGGRGPPSRACSRSTRAPPRPSAAGLPSRSGCGASCSESLSFLRSRRRRS